MFNKTVSSKEQLHKCINALDELEKDYVIETITYEIVDGAFLLQKKTWNIREVAKEKQNVTSDEFREKRIDF